MIFLKEMSSGYGGGKKQLYVSSLCLEKGAITAIVGNNGSGKSTLLRTLCGFLPYAGSIRLEDRELSSLAPRERARRIAYLPQLLPQAAMKVSVLVAHGRYARGSFAYAPGEADRKAIREAMEMTDVVGLAERRVDTLSGGERARAYLAMVIAQESDYLLLDEPASDMDISHQLLLGQIFRRLTSQGKGIIVSSHDLPMSFSTSDRIWLMAQGRVVAAGSPEEMAAQGELLKKTIGAVLAPTRDDLALYRYMLAKGG